MTNTDIQKILDILKSYLSWFQPQNSPERLQGGLLNYVWRVDGEPKSIIIKYFPPYIATVPEVALDDKRMLIEARALQAFQPGGIFSALNNNNIRPPQIYYADEARKFLVMEDVENEPNIKRASKTSYNWILDNLSGKESGEIIGNFIGNLHSLSFYRKDLAADFENISIQKTRLNLQYKAIAPLLKQAGIEDYQILGDKVSKLGEKYLQKGKNVIMGDLWPASIIPVTSGLRIIDWELAHYGYPAQDLAHFAAHLWMKSERAKTKTEAKELEHMLTCFFDSYVCALGSNRQYILNSQEIIDCSLHFAAEILVRTIGNFQTGYLYDGLTLTSPPIQKAIQTAVNHLRSPENLTTFSALIMR